MRGLPPCHEGSQGRMAELTRRGRTWQGAPHASPTAGAWPPWLGGIEALPGFCVGAGAHPVHTTLSPWVQGSMPVGPLSPCERGPGRTQGAPRRLLSIVPTPSLVLRPPQSTEVTSCSLTSHFRHSIPLHPPLCSPAHPGLPHLGCSPSPPPSPPRSPHRHRTLMGRTDCSLGSGPRCPLL